MFAVWEGKKSRVAKFKKDETKNVWFLYCEIETADGISLKSVVTRLWAKGRCIWSGCGARNDALFLAYRVAMPPQRFRWRKVFSRQANTLRSKMKRVRSMRPFAQCDGKAVLTRWLHHNLDYRSLGDEKKFKIWSVAFVFSLFHFFYYKCSSRM